MSTLQLIADSITVVSLIRMTYMIRFDHSDPSVNWEFSDEMMWTGVEVNAGIVCGRFNGCS